MPTWTIFLLPSLGYAFAWWLALDKRRLGAVRWVIPFALAFHAGTLIHPWVQGVFHFGFAKLLSATLWIGVAIWWVESFAVSLGRITLVLLPVAALSCWLPWFYPGAAFPLRAQQPLFVPHLFVGTLAYAVMFLAAIHAMLMVQVESRLRPGHAARAGWLTRLLLGDGTDVPPLMVLEKILFRFIAVGFALLLLTTLTGIVFSEETFGRPLRLEHKTVFSLIATVFFGLLLAGRRLWGWRGRRALKLAFWGFALLLLSYVGSRFVLEVVLGRF